MFGTCCSHFPNGIFELLDVFKLVIGLAALAILLLELIFLIIVFLRVLAVDFRVGVVVSCAFIVMLGYSLMGTVLRNLFWPFKCIVHFSSSYCSTNLRLILTRNLNHFLFVLDVIFGRRRSLLRAWSFSTLSTLCEDVIPHIDFLRKRSWHVFTTVDGTLLLSCFAFFVLFFFVWCVFSVIISHVDLVSELNTK